MLPPSSAPRGQLRFKPTTSAFIIGTWLLVLAAGFSGCSTPPTATDFDPEPLVTAKDHFQRGLTLHQQNKLPAALAEYDRAIAMDSIYKEAIYQRGLIRQSTGDLDGAIADFDRVLFIDRRALSAFAARSAAKSSQGNFQAVIDDCTAALTLAPESATLFYRLRAFAYQSARNFPAALADFDRTIAQEPNNLNLIAHRAEVKRALGDVAGAEIDEQRSKTKSTPDSNRGQKRSERTKANPKEMNRPPGPVFQPEPTYPLLARAAGLQGVVTVEFIITKTGDTANAFVVDSPGPLLSEAALAVVRIWKFTPGIKNGRAVNTRVQQKVEFNLEDATPPVESGP